MVDHKPLLCHLQMWCSEAHLLDPLRAIQPLSFICDNKSLVRLSILHTDKVTCVLDLVWALDETEEWAEEWGRQILDVIQTFDNENTEEDTTELIAEESHDEIVSDEEES